MSDMVKKAYEMVKREAKQRIKWANKQINWWDDLLSNVRNQKS